MRFQPRHTWYFGLLIFLCAAVCITQGLQVAPRSSATFELAANKGFFTLHAKDARVADILQQLKRMDVIDLQVDPSMTGTITVNLDGVTLEKLP